MTKKVFTNEKSKLLIIDNLPDRGLEGNDIFEERKENGNTDKFIKAFEETVKEIDVINLKNAIWVTCSEGLSRSPLFAACLLCALEEKEINSDKLLQNIQSVQDKRYLEGYYKGSPILKSPLAISRFSEGILTEKTVELSKSHLIEMAKSNDFGFRDKLTESINKIINNQKRKENSLANQGTNKKLRSESPKRD